MSNRRAFFGELIGGAAGVAASGLLPAARVLGANDRIRFGIIGAGARGMEIFQAAIHCPNVEAVAVADIYTGRFDAVKALVPQIKTYRDFRQLLEDKTIDAVLIATPQHQHVLNFVPAIQAGKDVYQEKTLAFNPGHARRMRKAFAGSGRVVQVGMQMNSSLGIQKIRELATHERMGAINAIETYHFRNAAHGGWVRKIPADCDPAHVDWPAFEGEAKSYPFDPQRYMNWRFYWDYSGGNVFENMVHQVGFWYGALGLNIPEAVTMTGANYRSPQMQVPDIMNVVMQQPEKILFSWSSTFGNNYYSEGYDYAFGTGGTLIHDQSDNVAYLPQSRRNRTSTSDAGASEPPIGRGRYKEFTPEHMQNFFDCVRSRKEPACPFEIGFRAAIACQMAIASYRQQRTVRWDPATDEIV
jgi:predicted dehydrogenase